jgi:CDP-glucose 4,6-dehydratase
LVVNSYRRSYFSDSVGPQLASVRAGNVIGGGDWATDRLVPDIVKAAMAGVPVAIRNPHSIRPWQHVLDPLAGYLTLASHLLSDRAANFAEGWNFGPDQQAAVDVRTLADAICDEWGPGGPELRIDAEPSGLPEAQVLKLDSTKALARLGWRPRLSLEHAIRLTIDWYRAFAQGHPNLRGLCEEQIKHYWCTDAPARTRRNTEELTCA